MTPCVPVGIVVFCPLGIWIASQSRLNVNSVFSYMASTRESYYATDQENDENRMTNDETISKSLSLLRQSFLRHSTFACRPVAARRRVLRHFSNTHHACSAC